jgi:uncharacterized protein DUF5985
MAEAIYLLCAATSLAAAFLLFRMWRRRGTRLLLWSCLCFAGLALNNVLLFVDLVVVPDVDLMLLRSGTAIVSVLLLLFGLVWESH